VELHLLCEHRKLRLEVCNILPIPHALDRSFEAFPGRGLAGVIQTYTLQLPVQFLCDYGTSCCQTFQSLLVILQLNARGLRGEFQAVNESEKISISDLCIHNVLYKIGVSLSSSLEEWESVKSRCGVPPTPNRVMISQWVKERYIAETNQTTQYYYHTKLGHHDKMKFLTAVAPSLDS
jgi:hypothetical protein